MHLINKNVFRLRMIKQKLYSIIILSALICTASLSYADASLEASDSALPTYTLPTLTVRGQEIANLRPASTYQSVVSNLDFDPRMDFQSRNMAEAQGDINIRGGIFEGTGIQVGAVTLIDPQTGHYSTELPIAPEMLTQPTVYTGSENSLYGFNSTAGTISYQWNKIATGGSLSVGVGENHLRFQRIYNAITGDLSSANSWLWGAEFEFSNSESDGTIAYGDHDFDRSTGRFQIIGLDSQTDFFVGKQSKIFNWPGMYTADKYIEPRETEDLKTNLIILNHRKNYQEDSYVNLSASHKRNTDNYELDALKEDGTIVDYPANHNTKVSSIALNGYHKYDSNLGIHYAAQYTRDNWKKIDPYTNPSVNASRSYTKLTILPEYQLKKNSSETIRFRFGGSYDTAKYADSEVSFISDIKWQKEHSNGNSECHYFSYSEASQLPGYVAIGDPKSGDGNNEYFEKSNLQRETSKTFELGTIVNRENLKFEYTLFYRIDDNLVDWTYKKNSEYARSATGVDLDTYGIEFIASKQWENIEAIISYNLINKNEDYGSNDISGSFYALNYAKQRITLGTIWSPNETVKVCIDNEWRDQKENSLRNSDNEAFFTHISVSIFPPKHPGLELFTAIDNLWNEDFEDVPGTPGKGRQGSLGATFRW